jgi:hypothetical protein
MGRGGGGGGRGGGGGGRGGGGMTRAQATSIRSRYADYDEQFRELRSLGRHREASIMKTRRDALSGQLQEAIRTLKR